MKRSQTQDNAILETSDGMPYGVYLGADYVHQHSCGIEGIHRMFGMMGGNANYKDHISTYDMKGRIRLHAVSHERRDGRKTIKDNGMSVASVEERDGWLSALLRRYDDEAEIVGAWDENDFAIAGYGSKGEGVIRMLHEGMLDKDVAIWIGGIGRNPFSTGGLVVIRPTLTPPELIATFDAAQLERRNLTEAAAETGIEERMVDMPVNGMFSIRAYRSLVPVWTMKDRKQDTAHPVMFWLDPIDSKKDNYGYFTVEELDQWTQGGGPVPKNPV